MLIQLKETEIKAALHDYIVKQGISLVGKLVDISFTAGRKESGISADLDITDIVETRTSLVLDSSSVGKAAIAEVAPVDLTTAATDPVAETKADDELAPEEEEVGS